MANSERRALLEIESERLGTRIDQYRDEIVLYLKRRVPGNTVEDLAQETLLTAHAYVNKGNTVKAPLAFLYKTANFVVWKSYRAQKAAAMTDTVADVDTIGLVSEAPSVERNVMSELEFEAFCVALDRLPKSAVRRLC